MGWQILAKELLESKKFNDKFSKNLLGQGAKTLFNESILDICIPSGEKKDLDEDNPGKNKVKWHHHSKGLRRKSGRN